MSSGQDPTLTIKMPHHQELVVQPGSIIIAYDRTRADHFGAIITEIEGLYVNLTFTPVGRPQRIGIGEIITAASTIVENFTTLPKIAPAPTIPPRRRRRRRGETPEVRKPPIATLKKKNPHYL